MRRPAATLAAACTLALLPLGALPAVATGTTGADTVSTPSLAFKTVATQRARQRPTAPVLGPAVPVTAPRTAPVAAPVSAPRTAPVAVPPAQAYSDRVLAATNAARSRAGLAPVRASSCADGYADRWARHLAAAGALSHQPLGPVLSACGASRVGENVAYGNVSADQMVQMWLDSPGHRANLLNAAFTHLGVGAVQTASGRWYGVQVFTRQ